MEKRFQREKISEHITRITGLANEMMYLLEGKERAALIDTGIGAGNLKKYIEEITEKPLLILLSHGHLDHAMAAWEFPYVYMSEKDERLYFEHSQLRKREEFIRWCDQSLLSSLRPVEPMKYHWLKNQEEFDLGGLTVIAYECPGHTAGSFIFLIKEERALFLGDACNCNTLVYDSYAVTVEEYRDALLRVEGWTKGSYDKTLFSHDPRIGNTEIISRMIYLCESVLKGESEEEAVQFLNDTGYMARKRTEVIDVNEPNLMYSRERIFKKEKSEKEEEKAEQE